MNTVGRASPGAPWPAELDGDLMPAARVVEREHIHAALSEPPHKPVQKRWSEMTGGLQAVLALLRSGCSSGAVGRWRALREVSTPVRRVHR